MTSDVTVIIPNWNGGSRLERTLQSVASQTLAPREVIVVDDASTDESAIAAERTGARVIRLTQNSGFSHAVNAGVRAAATPWVFILNNDVILEDNCVAALLEACQQRRACLAGPKLLKLRQPDQLDGSFDLLARSGCAWRAGSGMPDSAFPSRTIPVQFIPLTAALVDREVFLETGCLEEQFGTYLEDVEFFLRCALGGHSALYVSTAAAWHEGSATHGAWSPRMVHLIARNQLLLVARHWPRNWFRRYGWPVIAGQLLWGVLALRRGAGLAWLRGKWEGLRMYGDFRAASTPAEPIAFERILSASESRLRELQKTLGPERFWSAYFLCVPEGRQ